MKSVCVIGLGPAGLTSVKELRAHGLDVTAYDPSSKIGGRWALDWSTCKHGVWKEMCLNDPRTFIEFSDFPWKKEDFQGIEGVGEDLYGLYAHATEAQLYLQAYADKFDLGSSFMLNTRVTKIEREIEGWKVYTTSNGKESFKSFDGIVHCVGRYSVPHNPLISEDGSAALDNFSGKVIHSSDFHSAESMDGKKVLVIGHTVSGADITSAIAIRGRAARVVNSVRNVPMMFNRISRATNQVGYVGGLLGNRFTVWLSRTLPESLNMKGMRSQALVLFPEQITVEMTGNPELVANQDIMKSGASYAVDYVERLKAGLFALKAGIQSVEGNTVTFKDGSSEDFDIVICGTGYHSDLSLVPEDIKSKVMYESPVTGKRQPALYKWTLVPGEPTFAFSGQHSGIGPNWPAIEMASRLSQKCLLETSLDHRRIKSVQEQKLFVDFVMSAIHCTRTSFLCSFKNFLQRRLALHRRKLMPFGMPESFCSPIPIPVIIGLTLRRMIPRLQKKRRNVSSGLLLTQTRIL